MSPRHSPANKHIFIFAEIERERQRMISEAAYYRSEQRGFQGGADIRLKDWLLAEQEIDQRLREEVG